MPSHPDHARSLAVMQDARLRDAVAALNDLSEFVARPFEQGPSIAA